MSKDKDIIKEERNALDAIVTKYGLAREICPNSSEHVTNNDGIPGEVMFYHDALFLCRRIANMELGYSALDHMHWSINDAKTFYAEHNLAKTHVFQTTFMKEGKKALSNWYFKGRSQNYMAFLAYRWDNGLIFEDYKGRVEMCIENRKLEDLDNIREIIEEFQDKEEQVAKLNGKFDKIKAKVTDPQLQQILAGIDISVIDLMEQENNDPEDEESEDEN
tara:strand:+ start:638 stop:1294 length:657 start_codon:yes stop_codon:yes gene_type:complete